MKRNSPTTTLFLDIGGVLLSDGWDHHARRRAAANFMLDGLVDAFISSCFVHFHKPNADIFRLAPGDRTGGETPPAPAAGDGCATLARSWEIFSAGGDNYAIRPMIRCVCAGNLSA